MLALCPSVSGLVRSVVLFIYGNRANVRATRENSPKIRRSFASVVFGPDLSFIIPPRLRVLDNLGHVTLIL